MFHIHNSTIISSLLFFFVFFFRIVLAGKYFYERALVFIKQITKKAFCPCLQTPRCLTSRLASSPVNRLTLHYQFFVVLVQLQHHSKLFLVNLPQNLEHHCLIIMTSSLALHDLR